MDKFRYLININTIKFCQTNSILKQAQYCIIIIFIGVPWDVLVYWIQ